MTRERRCPGPSTGAAKCSSESPRWTLSRERCDECLQSWEIGVWDFDEQAWRASRSLDHLGDYPGLGRIVRRFGDGEHVLGADGEALDATIAARSRQLEIEEVKAVLAPIVGGADPQGSWGAQVWFEVVRGLALMFWGATPRLGRSWYLRDPKRAPFARIGDAIRFATPVTGSSGKERGDERLTRWPDRALGASARGWSSRDDGPVLTIAETRRPPEIHARLPKKKLAMLRLLAPDVADQIQRDSDARRVGGMRSGLVHATVSSHNGSTGGSANLSGIELAADLDRAIRASGVSDEDLALLQVVHATRKPDRIGAVRHVLLQEGALDGTEAEAVAKVIIAEHKRRIFARINGATRNLSRALRKLPTNAVFGTDPRDAQIPLPFVLHGQPREPDFGLVALLAPASSEEQEADARNDRPGPAKAADEIVAGDPSGWAA